MRCLEIVTQLPETKNTTLFELIVREINTGIPERGSELIFVVTNSQTPPLKSLEVFSLEYRLVRRC